MGGNNWTEPATKVVEEPTVKSDEKTEGQPAEAPTAADNMKEKE